MQNFRKRILATIKDTLYNQGFVYDELSKGGGEVIFRCLKPNNFFTSITYYYGVSNPKEFSVIYDFTLNSLGRLWPDILIPLRVEDFFCAKGSIYFLMTESERTRFLKEWPGCCPGWWQVSQEEDFEKILLDNIDFVLSCSERIDTPEAREKLSKVEYMQWWNEFSRAVRDLVISGEFPEIPIDQKLERSLKKKKLMEIARAMTYLREEKEWGRETLFQEKYRLSIFEKFFCIDCYNVHFREYPFVRQ